MTSAEPAPRVANVRAWEAFDSRGTPTVACRVELVDGAAATALVPSGASTGAFEASERRDGGARHGGRGVRDAVANVTGPLAAAVRGALPHEVDDRLRRADPSSGFAQHGANAVLAISLAAMLAAARSHGVSPARYLAGPDGPLLMPAPMVNIVSGGAHAGGLLDLQDFLVVPIGVASFAEAIERCVEVRRAAQTLATGRGHRAAVLVADEGGLGLALDSNEAALALVNDAIELAGLAPGTEAGIAIDVAATQLVAGDGYRLSSEDRTLRSAELCAELLEWCDRYPIRSIEDAFGENDWDGWSTADRLGARVQLIGDDLFATNLARLEQGIAAGVANAVLVKVNQNGLLRGTYDVLTRAHRAGYRTVVSARSGETEDTWLADLAVGWRAGQIKVGSTHRSERTAKWNRLLELEALDTTHYLDPWATVPGVATEENTA